MARGHSLTWVLWVSCTLGFGFRLFFIFPFNAVLCQGISCFSTCEVSNQSERRNYRGCALRRDQKKEFFSDGHGQFLAKRADNGQALRGGWTNFQRKILKGNYGRSGAKRTGVLWGSCFPTK